MVTSIRTHLTGADRIVTALTEARGFPHTRRPSAMFPGRSHWRAPKGTSDLVDAGRLTLPVSLVGLRLGSVSATIFRGLSR